MQIGATFGQFALVRHTATFAVFAILSFVMVNTLVVGVALHFFALVVATSHSLAKDGAVIVDPTFLRFALVRHAQAMSVLAMSKKHRIRLGLCFAHRMSSTINLETFVGLLVAQLVFGAMIGSNATFDLDTLVLKTFVVRALSRRAMIMARALDFGTFVLKTDIASVGVALVAVIVDSAFLLFARVVKTQELVSEVFFAVAMSQTVDIDTCVSAVFSAANLLIATVIDIATFDIYTDITLTLLRSAVALAMVMRCTFDLFADIVATSLLESAVVIVATFLLLTLIFETHALSVPTVFASLRLFHAIARSMSDTFNLHTFAVWFVTFLQDISGPRALVVFLAVNCDAFLVATSSKSAAVVMTRALNLDTLVIRTDFLLHQVAMCVIRTLDPGTLVILTVTLAVLANSWKSFLGAKVMSATFNRLALVRLAIANFGHFCVAICLEATRHFATFGAAVRLGEFFAVQWVNFRLLKAVWKALCRLSLAEESGTVVM